MISLPAQKIKSQGATPQGLLGIAQKFSAYR
jgi:hypothetical protein